ncbi:MAG: radical SAM protein [Deltaproteobacteria bacterium]|nr:MAG: radical SAM protein [Deltaproteobacteria bacterium]
MPSYIFSPVPSRRLGLSLGIDLVPFKTCTLDCIYCELGKTATPVNQRTEYVPFAELEIEIREFFNNNPTAEEIDFITLSGSGEPTLNTALPRVIKLLRQFSKTPIALLTNGTLFSRPEVRREVLDVDLILPSLDVVSDKLFATLNRPVAGLKSREIIDGLVALRREFSGKIWLEILFCAGINDTPEEVERLIQAAATIQPDRIQLNTVVRPGALPEAKTVTETFLKQLLPRFNPAAEIIAPFNNHGANRAVIEKTKETILATLKRRPCTVNDLKNALGLKKVEVIKILDLLLEKDEIKTQEHGDKHYFQILDDFNN